LTSASGTVLWERGQFAHQDYQILLRHEQMLADELVPGRRPCKAQRGVQFIYAAVRFDARMTLRDAPVVHQSRRAVVARARRDAHAGRR